MDGVVEELMMVAMSTGQPVGQSSVIFNLVTWSDGAAVPS